MAFNGYYHETVTPDGVYYTKEKPMATQIRGCSPPQQILNFKYNIEAAEAHGYIVTGPYSRVHYEDNCRPGILFAGELADALDYISQEIIKHDGWREPGPMPSR